MGVPQLFCPGSHTHDTLAQVLADLEAELAGVCQGFKEDVEMSLRRLLERECAEHAALMMVR